MTSSFLDKVYQASTAGTTRDLYDAWSDSYEVELGQAGYATPARCAAALAKFSSDLHAPVLDFGCGTGLSGQALTAAGFTAIDGRDLSADMLAQANDKGIYRRLDHVEADESFHHIPGDYAAIAAIGVIGVGAAPATILEPLIAGLDKGGLLVFSFNDHTLEDTTNEAYLNEWIDCGAVSLLMREHGDHLPEIDLGATVYVIEKN